MGDVPVSIVPTRQTTRVAPSKNDRSGYDDVCSRRGRTNYYGRFDRLSLSGPLHDPTSPRRQIIKQVYHLPAAYWLDNRRPDVPLVRPLMALPAVFTVLQASMAQNEFSSQPI
jgi:hypothetical protein